MFRMEIINGKIVKLFLSVRLNKVTIYIKKCKYKAKTNFSFEFLASLYMLYRMNGNILF